jgi:TPP-dependent pyruvate/acetoin dehydrogenase alpha subunit
MTVVESSAVDLSSWPPERLRQMLFDMVQARRNSERFFALQRQGRAGTSAPITGQEATVVGAAHALDPTIDWIVPQYREQVALARFGEEVLATHCLYNRGHPEGSAYPDHVRVFPAQISLAAQIPQALGLAWGMQLRKEQGVAAVFFGDGSSSEGDFYEAGNFAGVLKAPLIMMLVNNQWAISTPTSKQTAAATFADKAKAFGIPGIRVDGNDVIAVHDVVAAARTRALAGDGPTLIEAFTFRMGFHTTADDPSRYVPEDQARDWAERDPISRFTERLTDAGLWSESDSTEALRRADETFDRLFAAAETNNPMPDAFFNHVFANPPQRLLDQRHAFNEGRAQ